MIGLDTNALVRYIVQDDERQSGEASRLIETHCSAESPGFVALIVLAELVWVLEGAYGYSKDIVLRVLEQLLHTAELTVESPVVARLALADFRAGPAGFADYLIAQAASRAGCEVTYTFDRKAAKSAHFSLPGR